MRVIDVNDFLAKLKERHEYIMQDPEVSKRMKWCEAVHYGATTEIIEKMPTIEATPVVHGRWEKHKPDQHGNRKPKCSVCGEYHLAWWSEHTRCNFCPNCGAKMEGGVSDG